MPTAKGKSRRVQAVKVEDPQETVAPPSGGVRHGNEPVPEPAELPPGAVRLRTPPDRLIKPNVAIVGFTDHRAEAFKLPHDEWEIWGLNELHRYHALPLWDRWFEIHDKDELQAGDPEHIKALATFDIPVYMQAHYPEIPPSVPFPKEIVEQVLGTKYFTSSPAWEIGLAITMGARKIHLYGIDMAQESEYARERNCVEFLLGVAKGLGIEIHVPETSDLLHSVGQYAFGQTGTAFGRKIRERTGWLHGQDNNFLGQIRQLEEDHKSLMARIEAEYHGKREQLLCQRFQVFGAIQDCEYWNRSWAVGAGKKNEPTPDRTLDPRTGITSDDTKKEAA